MKLDKLRLLRDELIKEFGEESIEPAVFYHFGGKWNKLDDQAPITEHADNCLTWAGLEPISYHPTSSREAWFSCDSMHCSISLTFVTPPRKAKRRRCRDR